MKAATEAIAEILWDKNLSLTNINHYIYVASKVIVEEINETEIKHAIAISYNTSVGCKKTVNYKWRQEKTNSIGHK